MRSPPSFRAPDLGADTAALAFLLEAAAVRGAAQSHIPRPSAETLLDVFPVCTDYSSVYALGVEMLRNTLSGHVILSSQTMDR
jgi:hypothetical protein